MYVENKSLTRGAATQIPTYYVTFGVGDLLDYDAV
jgi:hypothetical protein